MTEERMVGWHHQLNGHEFEQALEMVKDREAWHAACCRRGSEESATTERLNNNNKLSHLGFPGGTSGKECACQCRRQKIPSRREWLPTPALFPVESHGQRSLAGYHP